MAWSNKTRPNATAKIPYAYMASEDDPLVLVPDPEVVPLVEKAMDYLEEGNSVRQVSEWLTREAGRKISHQGIKNIWRNHRGETSKRIKELDEANAKRQRGKTPKQKRAAELRKNIGHHKRVQKVQENALRKMAEKEKAKKDKAEPEVKPVATPVTAKLDFSKVETAKEEQEVIFAPNPGPQTEFLAASEQEVLYGGAAGGGKSYAVLADPLRYFGNGNFNGLVLRRTSDELRELIWKSQEMYPKAYPGAKWGEKKSQWVFVKKTL